MSVLHLVIYTVGADQLSLMKLNATASFWVKVSGRKYWRVDFTSLVTNLNGDQID